MVEQYSTVMFLESNHLYKVLDHYLFNCYLAFIFSFISFGTFLYVIGSYHSVMLFLTSHCLFITLVYMLGDVSKSKFHFIILWSCV